MLGGVPVGPLAAESLTREQIVGFAGALLLTLVLIALLVRVSAFLKKRGAKGSIITLVAAFLWLPLAFAALSLEILGFSQGVLNPEEVAAAKDAKVGTLLPARVLHFLVIVLGFHLALWIVDLAIFTEKRERETGLRVPKILRDTVRWGLLFTAAFFVAGVVFDFDIGKLSILAGALSIALSLALGPTLGSLISGITLISERPFQLGDWIEVDGSLGKVDQITWRSTRIITRDKTAVVFPNSKLADVKILNLSRPETTIRIRIKVGVHYRSPPLKCIEVMEEAVRHCPGVVATPEPWARIAEYGDSTINWDVFFWINDAARMERIRTACAERMWYALQRAGIEMSSPVRNVVMRREEWDSAPAPTGAAESRRVARNLALLRAVPALATLPSDALERLSASMRDEIYCDGERITHEGVRGDRMYFVVEGTAKALVGRAADHEVKTVGAGEYFGERGMLTGAPRAATFAAAGTLRVASLAASDVQPILRERPEFAEQMATLVAERKHHLDELTDKAAADAGKPSHASEHSSLLDEIAGFFHLPRHNRRGNGPRP